MKTKYSIILIAAIALSGCTTVVRYNPSYLEEATQDIKPTIEGKALIVTERKEDERLYSQKPSSLTGASNTLQGKFGEYLWKIAETVFDESFKEGAEHSYETETENGYRVIIKPEILNFDYKYNQLKNIGFAITPESSFGLYVEVFDGTGTQIFERKYESDYVSGGTYMMNFSPAEKVNKSVHRALVQLMIEVSKDLDKELKVEEDEASEEES